MCNLLVDHGLLVVVNACKAKNGVVNVAKNAENDSDLCIWHNTGSKVTNILNDFRLLESSCDPYNKT